MSRKYKVFFLFFILFYSLALEAFEKKVFQNNSLNEYQIDRMISCSQGVILLVDNQWISAQGVQASQEGILVLEGGTWMPLSEAVFNCDYYTWQCRRCRAWNPQGASGCINCGKPRDS